MKRSLKYARGTVAKQKKIIKQQRQLIATLKAAQKELEKKSLPLDGEVVANQFILGQLSKRKLSRYGRRYNEMDKNFALALHYYSPQCYRMLRKIFVLPTTRSLSKWLENVDVYTGFNEPVLEMLKIKCKTMSVQERLCTIAFDEMTLKELITYNSKSDVFDGFVNAKMTSLSQKESVSKFTKSCNKDRFYNLADERLNCPQFANEAMAVVVRGIRSDFKQIIGYFVSHNAMPGEQLQEIIQEAIRKVQATGLIPKVVVMDQGSNNQSAFNLLGISEAKPWIGMGGEKIYFFYDAPHLLKSVRNNFKKYDVLFDGEKCKWEHIVHFYNLDCSLSHRLAPRLSAKHLDLPPFSPMRVCLAAQTLSYSVASGILTMVALNTEGLNLSATHTAKFVEFIDSLFDAFNSSSMRDAKVMKSALKANSPHWKFLEDAEKKLKSLKLYSNGVVIRNPPCVNGWIKNISSLKLLWADMNQNYDVKYLFTRRLTQDCVENIFSTIRLRGGNNTRPDCGKFRDTLRMVLTNQLLRPSEFGNCEDDVSEFLVTKKDIEKNRKVILLSPEIQNANLTETYEDIQFEDVPDDVVSANSRSYVTGWVCSKLKHDHCREKLSSVNETCDPSHVHISMKKYSSSAKMLFPNDFASKLSLTCMSVFSTVFYTFLRQSCCGVRKRMKALVEIPPDFPACSQCASVFIDKFLNVTIKAFLNRINDAPKDKKAGKRNQKYLKLSNQ